MNFSSIPYLDHFNKVFCMRCGMILSVQIKLFSSYPQNTVDVAKKQKKTRFYSIIKPILFLREIKILEIFFIALNFYELLFFSPFYSGLEGEEWVARGWFLIIIIFEGWHRAYDNHREHFYIKNDKLWNISKGRTFVGIGFH